MTAKANPQTTGNLNALLGDGTVIGAQNALGIVGGTGYYESGASWLSDSESGFNYETYLNKKPTIFYDPSASTSLNRGTYRNPYNTVAAVQARCVGNMSGQVLGIKRGTTSASLSLTCYGTSSGKFSIVPYGDAAAMPYISGAVLQTGWTSAQASPQQVWKKTITSKGDCYELSGGDYQRLWGLTAASEALMFAAITAYAASPKAGTYGCQGYVGTTCYIYLLDGSLPNSANNIYCANAQFGLLLTLTDVSGTGYVDVAGLRAGMTYDSAIAVKAANVASANAPAGVTLLGNWTDHVGSRELARLVTAGIAADGIVFNGPTTASAGSGAPATAGYVAGNYSNDILNNAIELCSTNGWVVEYNLGKQIGGCSIVELYQLCTNAVIRYNRGYNDVLTPSSIYTGYKQASIWCNNFNGAASPAADNTKNGSHKIYANYGQDAPVRFLDHTGGQNDVIFNNTWMQKNWAGAMQFSVWTGGVSATGNSYFNNHHYHNNAYLYPILTRINPSSDSTPVPTMNYNSFNLAQTTFTNYAWELTSTAYYSMANWRTATSQEANSTVYNSNGNTANGTFASLNITEQAAPYPVLGAATDIVYPSATTALYQAGQTIAAQEMKADDLGRPVLALATPNIGNYQGTGA